MGSVYMLENDYAREDALDNVFDYRLKKKDYLVRVDRRNLPPRDNPGVHMFKIKLG